MHARNLTFMGHRLDLPDAHFLVSSENVYCLEELFSSSGEVPPRERQGPVGGIVFK